jgi:pilus assembly protein Flp/PilA
MRAIVRQLFRDESGVTAIEYGMIAALIAVAIIVIVGSLGTSLSTTFNNINTSI